MRSRPGKREARRRRGIRLQAGRKALAVLLACVAVYALIRLIGYGADWISSRNTARELQKDYYGAGAPAPESSPETPAGETAVPDVEEKPAETALPSPKPTGIPTAVPPPAAETPLPAETAGNIRLGQATYPPRKGAAISEKFQELRRKNRDIVGWLTVEGLLDEAVVQRDNVFYLNHDAKGRENVNGAIFLDAAVSLVSRPWSAVLYGHNMKNGTMFGALRNFESSSFYRRNPFVTFNSMYEDGRYVIFSVGEVSTVSRRSNYLDFYGVMTDDRAARQKAIDTLLRCSVHSCTLEVKPEDQLLLLVTCVEEDENRRVVAARRIREGESEEKLKETVSFSRRKK